MTKRTESVAAIGTLSAVGLITSMGDRALESIVDEILSIPLPMWCAVIGMILFVIAGVMIVARYYED